MSQHFTRRNLIIALVILLAMFSFFIVYSYQYMKRSVQETRTVNRTLQSLRVLEDIMDDMQDIDSKFQGYLISADKRLLDSYQQLSLKISRDTPRIIELYQLYPQRRDRYEELISLINRKTKIEEAIIFQLGEGGNRPGVEAAGEENVILDSIRTIIHQFESQDRVVLNRANTKRQEAAQSTAKLFIVLAIVFIVALLLLFWRLARSIEIKREYEQQVSYLAGLTEKTHDAIISTDLNFVIRSWNQGAYKMYGYTVKEAEGQVISSLLNLSGKKEDLEKYRRELDEQGYYKGELQVEKKSGEAVYVHTSVSLLQNDKNEAGGYVIVHKDISERKKSEHLLQTFNDALSRQVEEKTAQTASILERISEGFYSLDMNWNFTYMNKTASIIMDCDPTEIVGKNLWKEYPEAVSHNVYQEFLKAFDDQNYRQLEFFYQPYSKWLTVDIYPSFTGLSVFFRDITERKRAEEVLEHSNERFEMISRTTNDAIWEWDLETGKMWANETHQQLYGLTKDDAVPSEQDWLNRIHPDDRERMLKKQAEAIAGTTNVFITEYRFDTEKDGYRNVYDRCYIVRNARGKAIRILGSIMDITGLKKTEERLKRREAQLAASIENTPNVAIQWYNSEGIVMYWNRASELLFGWSSEDALGNTLEDLIHTPEEFGGFLKLLDKVAATGVTIGPDEYSFRKKNGSAGFCLATIYAIPSVEGETLFVCTDVDITESKKFAEALQQSEEKYRSIIDQASDGIFIMNEEGNHIEVNHAGLVMSGYSRDELLKMNAADLLPPGELPVAITKKAELKAGESFVMELGLTRKDKTVCEVEVSYKRLSNGLILAIKRDITERKKALEEIRNSEETRRRIMNSALDAIVGMDTRGLITIWTPQAEKIFGWKEEEVLGSGMSDTIIPQQYRAAHREGLARYLQTGKGPVLNKMIEIFALHRSGSEFPIELSILPVKQGGSEFFCAFIRDITERRKTEQAVRESEEKYRTLVEQAVDAIALYDANGKILDVNTGAVNLLGYTKDEILQLSLTDILTKEELKQKPVRYDVLREGNSTVKERRMIRKDGQMIETEVRSQQLPDGRFLSVIRDLTERIKAEKVLAASYEEIRKLTDYIQGVREDERTNIAREIHDELGQQLTVLKMDASWLKKKMTNASEPIRQKLKDLISMLDETVRTVRRISSELRPSILDDLGLVAAMEWQLGEFEKRSDIATRFTYPAAELVLAETTKTALFRVLQESLTNVARHSAATEVIVIIQIIEKKLILSIADNGNGFDIQGIEGKKTLGILGMKERIAMIGGIYEINTRPSEGTQVLVELSLTNTQPGIV